MTINPKYSYLDPTYPAYYWYFDRPKTLLCFSLRRFILMLATYDIIFSSIGITFGFIYIIIDQLNHRNLLQSNELIQNLVHMPIGLFFDNRLISRPSWTIDTISKNLPMIFYFNIMLNGLSLLCSINMITAIKYYKPYRASIYFLHKAAYFVHTTALVIEWVVNNEKAIESMRIFYGTGDLGVSTTKINLFCLALLEFLWKTFTLIMIFRSIQYLRDYCLRKQCNSIKNCNNENQSSTFLVIDVSLQNTFVNKQFNV